MGCGDFGRGRRPPSQGDRCASIRRPPQLPCQAASILCSFLSSAFGASVVKRIVNVSAESHDRHLGRGPS